MPAGRNDPCPCGSGRKYKHCHGAIAPMPDPQATTAGVDLRRSLDQALGLHQKGFLAEAEPLYREILRRSPRHADAMNMLGILCAQRGDPASALEWIGKAIAADSKNAAYQVNFGKALMQLNRPREACNALEVASALRGDHAETFNALGLARMGAANLQGAADAFRRALSLKSGYAEAHGNLGLALHRQGEHQEAEASLRRALELESQSGEMLSNLGMVLRAQGRKAEAVEIYRAAFAQSPRDPVILTNLGNALIDLSHYDEAITYFREAIAIAPDYAEAHYNWGVAHLRAERFHAAAEKFSDVLAKNPNFPEAASSLGTALHDLGRIEEAIDAFRRALLLAPGEKDVHSQLLFSLLHSPEITPQQVFTEHLVWARTHSAGIDLGVSAHRNSPDPERRLRVGYVSGDFRHHSVAQFVEPVLARHDRDRVEIFCYSNVAHVDGITERLRRSADHWREVSSQSDDSVAELIHSDGIDVLVDLSGHTKYNRLLVFARKPAPVQASWLGYLNTTGLSAIDYRITDHCTGPEGLLGALHCERLVRMPDCQWCYQPPLGCPEVTSPPSTHGSPLTFGAFHSLPKIGPQVIALWCRLLEHCPDARLLIAGLGLGSMRDEYLSRFSVRGIAPERIDLRDFQSFQDYLGMHAEADVMLDTFPYAGGTTTCHALWMGVPVVSLVGDSVPSRSGASLLRTIGLEELVADTPQQYIDTACNLGSDPGRLSALRLGMRKRMTESALTDVVRFTRNLEDAYRSMWRRWCQDRKAN